MNANNDSSNTNAWNGSRLALISVKPEKIFCPPAVATCRRSRGRGLSRSTAADVRNAETSRAGVEFSRGGAYRQPKHLGPGK